MTTGLVVRVIYWLMIPQIRAADEIIDEGHFIGKALGEALNGYRPIVELMNTNFLVFMGWPRLVPQGIPLPQRGDNLICQ
jgi:hypothetical protein